MFTAGLLSAVLMVTLAVVSRVSGLHMYSMALPGYAPSVDFCCTSHYVNKGGNQNAYVSLCWI